MILVFLAALNTQSFKPDLWVKKGVQLILVCVLIFFSFVSQGVSNPSDPIAYRLLNDGPLDHQIQKEVFHSGQFPLVQVTYDLFKEAHRAHVQQIGPTLSPHSPGWSRLVDGKYKGTWQAPTQSNGKWVSWIEGRGGILEFPVSQEKVSLEDLLVWIEPVAPHQVVSVFLDGELVKNLSLRSKPRFYRLTLPHALTPGEHRLRFWFRFTRPAPWGGRTPAALGPLYFLPKGAKPTFPTKWTGHLLIDQAQKGALFAPPPTQWRYYFVVPHQSDFKTEIWVDGDRSLKCSIEIASDGHPNQVIWSRLIPPKTLTPVHLDLRSFARTPIRFTLRTSEIVDSSTSKSEFEKVAWLNPRILSPHPNPQEFPEINRVLVWSIAGLRWAPLIKALDLPYQYPALHHLFNQSWLLPSLWSEATVSQKGHEALLNPDHDPNRSLPALLNQSQVDTSLITTEPDFPIPLQNAFNSTTQFQTSDPQFQYTHLMQTVVQRLKVNTKKVKKWVYLSTAELRTPFKGDHEFSVKTHPLGLDIESDQKYSFRQNRLYQLYLNQLKWVDFKLSLLLAEMANQNILDQTAIILVGSVGQSLGERKSKNKLYPEVLEVPALIWHPHKKPRAPHWAIQGGHLGHIGPLIFHLLSLPEDQWSYPLIASHLLQGFPLPLNVNRISNSQYNASRLGGFFLHEPIHQDAHLWNLRRSRELQDNLSQDHPITLRAIRDGISSSHLSEGLE